MVVGGRAAQHSTACYVWLNPAALFCCQWAKHTLEDQLAGTSSGCVRHSYMPLLLLTWNAHMAQAPGTGCHPLHMCVCVFFVCFLLLQHLGRVHVAAFSDTLLHNELLSKAMFWQQTSFYGIDMTPLYQPAVDGYFTQVCCFLGLHVATL